MRKILHIIGLAFVLVLTACRGNGVDDEIAFQQHAFKSFQIDAPENWRKVSKENFANTIPENAIVIFLSKADSSDFIANANVVKESLNTDASSLEYAKANILLGSKAITDYRPVSSDEVLISGVKTVFHLFRARNATAEPLLHFSQSYFAQDRIGYTVTCVSKEDDSSQQQICEQIVKSFRFL